jgi:hypothetical protein
VPAKALIAALLLLPTLAFHALAADRWEEAAGGAVAILPVPSESEGIAGGSLFCAQQKWGLLLRTVAVDTSALGPSAVLGLDGNKVVVSAKATPGFIQAELPAELLGALRTGSRFRFEMGTGDVKARAIFNLKNSGKVLEAIAPRCSQIDMSGYESVRLDETGAAVDEAATLFAGEIKLMKAATTGATPVVRAIRLDLDGDKHLLFGALCGSTNYYGASGCTLWGWAKAGGEPEWKIVYETCRWPTARSRATGSGRTAPMCGTIPNSRLARPTRPPRRPNSSRWLFRRHSANEALSQPVPPCTSFPTLPRSSSSPSRRSSSRSRPDRT